MRHLRVFGSVVYAHVPKEKRRKLDAKAEKFILVGYSDENKGYKFYNPRTNQARVSCDVEFDESTSWYLPSPLTSEDSSPILEEEASEAEMPRDEGDIRALQESLILFRLSGLNERQGRRNQSDTETESSGDSALHSPCRKPRRRLTCKQKGKRK